MAAMPPSRGSVPDPNVAELRAAMVAAGRRLGARGLIAAGEGNISVRLAGPPAPLPGAAILERHGAVAVGGMGLAGLRHAVDRLELVEVLCRAWLDSLLVRAARSR